MDFDFFAHDTKIQNQRMDEADAKRKLEYEISLIRQQLHNSIMNFAAEHTHFTQSGGTNNEINLFYGNSNLNIIVHGANEFTVTKLHKGSTTPQFAVGSRVDKDDMMTKVVDFIRNQG